MSDLVDHEVVVIFKKYLQPLSVKLTEMLNEHFSHQTERRGCGYTQATRVLAEFINFPRDSVEATDLKIFKEYGYQCEYVQPVDMFCQTIGLECVAKLVKIV